MTNNLKTNLHVRNIELLVHLGWEKEEREQRQLVTCDINVHFNQLPKACHTDDLADTFCYAKLVSLLHDKVTHKAYKLVEHLTADIYKIAKSEIQQANIKVSLTKHPQVPGLSGGVIFSYGDELK